MAFVKDSSKMNAIKAFINTWLKDLSFYCHNCNENFDPTDTNEHGHWIPCCEKPEVGNNKTHTRAVAKQNLERKKMLKNRYASTDDQTIRHGVSMPVRMYHDLNSYFISNYQEKLFQSPEDLTDFMKSFPMFCVPDKV